MLQDPAVLERVIPGCEGLEKIGDDEYRMKMKMALGSFSSAFDGKVRIADQVPPASFRLVMEGAGMLGHIKGDGLLKLSASGDGTEVVYEGDAQVGGTMAAFGQGLIDGTSRMMMKRFFEKLAEEVSAAG